jgi:vacuolar-type H+-ATPase subunit H
MDVLKEIQQAEKQAEEIDRQFHEKAQALLASIVSEIQDIRAQLENKIEQEGAALERELRTMLEEEKRAVLSKSTEEREALTKSAKANESRAVDLIVKKLGL